jgi:hypothetical protein
VTLKAAVAVFVLIVLASGGSFAQTIVQIISIDGHRKRFDVPAQDAILRYFLIDVTKDDWDGDGTRDTEPRQPVAVLALFVGGDGRVNLTPTTRGIGGGFPTKVAYDFAAEGFIVAVVDAGSDFLAHNHPPRTDQGFPHQSGLYGHRLPHKQYGEFHKTDLESFLRDVRQRFPGLPVWMLGTSMGSVSVAVAATELRNGPDGLIMTVPDRCETTQPADHARLPERLTASPRVQVRSLSGGRIGFGSGCLGLNAHNFLGIESDAVSAITTWIKETGATRQRAP